MVAISPCPFVRAPGRADRGQSVDRLDDVDARWAPRSARPCPPSSTTATTTYFGAFAGQYGRRTATCRPCLGTRADLRGSGLARNRDGVEREALERRVPRCPSSSAVTPANPASHRGAHVRCDGRTGGSLRGWSVLQHDVVRIAHVVLDVRLPQRAAVRERGVRIGELQRRHGDAALADRGEDVVAPDTTGRSPASPSRSATSRSTTACFHSGSGMRAVRLRRARCRCCARSRTPAAVFCMPRPSSGRRCSTPARTRCRPCRSRCRSSGSARPAG